jgi:hypothetical protein
MMRRRRMTSSWRDACTSVSLFTFWCLDTNRGEDSYLYHFHRIFISSVCNGHVLYVWWSWWTRTYLCVACKTFYGDLNLFIYLCMLDYYAYISMYDDVMYLWLCLVIHVVGVILCVFMLYHYILSLDYTYFVRNLTFCKIVQKCSHKLHSVNFVLIQPIHIFRGAPCTNLENKTLLCLIVEKL